MEKVKPWYKKWWVVVLFLLFFPITVFVIPFLVWKTDWNKGVKIGITILCIIVILSILSGGNERLNQAQNFVKKAEINISENKIDEAMIDLKESQKLNTNKSNTAYQLEEKIKNLKSEEFLNKSLSEMSDIDFESLKKKELKTKFIDHEGLNKLFLVKLYENIEKRVQIKTELEKISKQKKEEADKLARESMISKQFSAWNGEHIKLTRMIKEGMNDPKSFEHVSSKYWEQDDHIIVLESFRGKNAFGGVVLNSVKAKISIDGENIEILEQ